MTKDGISSLNARIYCGVGHRTLRRSNFYFCDKPIKQVSHAENCRGESERRMGAGASRAMTLGTLRNVHSLWRQLAERAGRA